MVSDAVTPTRSEKNRMLGLVSVGHGIAHWYNGMLSVLYPVLTTALGLTYSQVGLIDSSRGVVAVIVSLAGGYLADRLGRRQLVLGLCLVSLGTFHAAVGFAETFIIVLVLLALGSIGNSLWHPYAIPVLSTIFPKRKGMALALHDAGANTLHGLSPIVVGALLGVLGWRLVTQMHLWPGLVMGVLILLLLPALETPSWERVTQPDYRQALQTGILYNRQFLLASVVSACLTMGRIGLFTFLPLFLAFELGQSSTMQGLYMGLLTFAGALIAPGAGALADRIGWWSVLFLGLLTASVATAALVFAQPGLLLFATIALLGVALFSTRSLIFVYVTSVTPEEVGGSSIGAIFSLNRLFGVVSPAIAGLIADTYGLRYVFYFFAALVFMGALLMLEVRRERNTAQEI